MCSNRPERWVVVVVVVVVVMVVVMANSSTATKMHYIHWNTSNPIFRIDNTDHIIDVNKGNIPFEYDQVNIICPVYSQDTSQDEAEKYIIYNVSKEEYDTCRITNPSPRVIAVCDKPYKLMYFTITFRSFTPQPGGLEFRPGQDYYFISTSSQDDLHQRIGGRCSTHHMKVVFKVCCDPASQPAQDQANTNHLPPTGSSTTRGTSTTTTTSTTSTSSTKPSTTTTTPKTSTTTTTTSTTSTTSTKTTSRKNGGQQTKHNNKKTDYHQPDRSQNEVVKNEELTLNSSPSCSSSSLLLISLLLTGLTLLHHHNYHYHDYHRQNNHNSETQDQGRISKISAAEKSCLSNLPKKRWNEVELIVASSTSSASSIASSSTSSSCNGLSRGQLPHSPS